MVHIRKLIMENFQSHEYTEIDFSEGLNVIVGPSDQGKSAILRAIKWVLYNEPRGSDFIKHGATYSRVSLELSSGKKIIRERSPSKNRYSLVDENGDVQVFEGFGNDIPREIINAHGIPKVILDTDIGASLNIGEQLEGPFLLAQTGAVRAKALGRLTGIHVIDKAIRDCVADLRRESQNGERIKGEIEELGRSIEAYSAIERLKDEISSAEKNISQLEALGSLLEKCRRISGRYAEITDGIAKEEEVVKRLEQLHISEARLAEVRGMIDALKIRKSIRDKVRTNCSEIARMENDAKRAATIVAGSERIYERLDVAMKRVRKLKQLKDDRDAVEKSINEGKNYLSNLAKEIDLQVDNISRVMREAKKCPLCMNEIGDETIERISSKYREAE